MAAHAGPAGGAAHWRTWLRDLVRDLRSDDWDKPAGATSGTDEVGPHSGPQASLDEVLRDAAEARDPGEEGRGAT
jgi:hypothetical protein